MEENCRARKSSANPRRAVELYDEYVQLRLEADKLRAERNENSARMKGKLSQEERDALIAAGQQLKDALAAAEDKVGQLPLLCTRKILINSTLQILQIHFYHAGKRKTPASEIGDHQP